MTTATTQGRLGFWCEDCRSGSVWFDTDDRHSLGRAITVICWQCELVLASFDQLEELVAAALATTVPRPFAQALVRDLVTGTGCELVADNTVGRCPEEAVAVLWEHGFTDGVCQHHADRAFARGADVVFTAPEEVDR